jgi:cytochrome c553
MSTNLRPLLAAALLASASCAAAADPQAGAARAQVCQACHGLDGNSTVPDYPKLGGQRRITSRRRCAITSPERARTRSWPGSRSR